MASTAPWPSKALWLLAFLSASSFESATALMSVATKVLHDAHAAAINLEPFPVIIRRTRLRCRERSLDQVCHASSAEEIVIFFHRLTNRIVMCASRFVSAEFTHHVRKPARSPANRDDVNHLFVNPRRNLLFPRKFVQDLKAREVPLLIIFDRTFNSTLRRCFSSL